MADHTRLLGSWTLVACESIDEDGTVSHPLGSDAAGQLMYTASGHVSAQLLRSGQARFPSDDYRAAEPARMAEAWINYFGYFGRFTVDEAAGVVVHHIEGGWFPNLSGARQVRRYRFDGQDLVLDADTAWGKVRNVWRGATAGGAGAQPASG